MKREEGCGGGGAIRLYRALQELELSFFCDVRRLAQRNQQRCTAPHDLRRARSRPQAAGEATGECDERCQRDHRSAIAAVTGAATSYTRPAIGKSTCATSALVLLLVG